MEGFWEKFVDISIMVIKASIVFFAIRVILMFSGYTVSIPYLDPILYRIFDFIQYYVPIFDIPR